ncbi:MAG: hypothetical protein N4J56_007282 [Chroococcidiopsis sp. SAG 2025]|uniref:hypothetical protein n=1 Tax=Chroococcidiopsis sp. SAG 2025 TaxID=171389 RepID=UPI0029370801|nr:hypothetical protein [Chroococcidiopsis sp. SAG 2025]MDV2997577.1 hypothetical protein [Chroococcidiopsis sp. SAG 2025]
MYQEDRCGDRGAKIFYFIYFGVIPGFSLLLGVLLFFGAMMSPPSNSGGRSSGFCLPTGSGTITGFC